MQEATHKLGNILDFVISRTDDDIIDTITVLPRSEVISDHHPIRCTLRVNIPHIQKKTVTTRSLRNLDATIVANDLTERLNVHMTNSTSSDTNQLATLYESCANEVLNIHAPQVDKPVKNRRQHPWYNDAIHLERRKRRRLERRWRKTRALEDRQAYANQSKHVVDVIRQAKQAYFRDKLSVSPMDAFKIVDSLIHVQDIQLPACSSDNELADRFVDFFADKVTKIRTTLDADIHVTPHETVTVDPFPGELTSFAAVSEDDLFKTIKSSKTKTCTIDPLPTRILKDDVVLDAILPFLTVMINSSLKNGVMPDCLKNALVVPLLKKQGLDPDLLSNYRPVSNIQFIGKLIEKCVANQLCQHMSTYDRDDKLQSAYKSAHSTETALLKVKNDCDTALDAGRAVLLVMLDLSAAFDTIDHGILLDRLHSFVGVKGSARDWFKSYLTGRTQKVIINSCASKTVPLDIGVPQGSVLGPLLFLIYILPLQHIIRKYGISYHGYADDTQLYLEFDPKDESALLSATVTLENCISELRQWMVLNKLKLNDNKTEFTIFASRHYHTVIMSRNPTIKIGSSVVIPGRSVRNLGVVMDCNLTMKDQINSITRSMYYHMRGIRFIRNYLDDSTCTKAVMALVISRLDYANAMLAGVSEHGLRKLQVAQNSAARLISRTHRSEHITPTLHQLHWLPVFQRISFKTLCIVYKCLSTPGIPTYLTGLFVKYTPSRQLRSSTSGNQLMVNRSKSGYGDRRFGTFAAKLWNSLPQHIQEAPSTAAFKKSLKTFLFVMYYNN